MGKFFVIDKIKEEKEIHYYFVSDLDYPSHEFYIGIDPLKNCVLFFLSTNLEIPVGIINFNEQNHLKTNSRT
jgi:hypothetical protein